MKRILFVDTYYPDFVNSLPDPIGGDYETELRAILSRCFGTFDAFSHYIKAEGWQAADVIANHSRLQRRWAMENLNGSWSDKAIVLQQIESFKPDVLFLQDLSLFNASELELLSKKYLLAAQCSCAIHPGKYSDISVLFTSLPLHVERFRALGVPTVEYLPLAFDPRMLSEESPKKQFGISFVGGVGKRSHWKAGTEMLERVADVFKERFIWFGYGIENLEKGSPLIPCYGGPCFGRDMYSVYGRSAVVVNRHGEVSEGFTNNLRCFEASGVGALLVTEWSHNVDQLFPVGTVGRYRNIDELMRVLDTALQYPDTRSEVARRGQQHTLKHHTYAHRMKVVSEVLTHALEKVAA